LFILIRHAVAVSKQGWFGEDRVRPLTAGGMQQSEALVTMLAAHGIARLLTSPTVRCESTLAPASNALSVPIEPIEALAVHASVAGLLDVLASPALEQAALCTHGETFAALSRAWGSSWTGASRAPDLADTPKGGSWVIQDYNTTAATARFVLPTPPNRSRGADSARSGELVW